MVAPNTPFLQLTAGDLMSRDLVLIPQAMSLRAAARCLAQAQVSGAPIVDSQGRCIGVLSSVDFVRWMEKDRGKSTRHCTDWPAFFSSWQVGDVDTLPDDCVRNCMTTDPVTVRATAPIGQIAQQMLDAHIHRVVVVDEQGRPVGVVSSTDMLAAIARITRQTEFTAEGAEERTPRQRLTSGIPSA